jgi:hypothetical protein
MRTPKTPTSLFRNIFLGSLGILLVAIIILGVSFLGGGNTISSNNVDVAITTKTFVDGGESLPVDVTIVNKNKLPIELATLILEYPQGSGDNAGTVARISRDIPNIAAGATHQESFIVQLYGTQNSQKTITAHMEFRVQGSNAVYDKDQPTTVTIRTSPVTITLAAPDKAVPNQDIPLVFSITGNGAASLANTAMVLQYPDGFTYANATPPPTTGNNVWYLGDLPPGSNRTITVHGSLVGSVTDLKTIRASVGSQNASNEQLLDTTYNSLAQVIPLSNAFIDAHFAIGTAATGSIIPISGTQQVRVTIPWKNTLSVPLTNAQISVSFSGSAYSPSLVEPINGFFDTVNNKIVWTSREDQDLTSINPGQHGEISFSFRPGQITSSSAVTNPVVKVGLSILGYQSGGTKLTADNVDTKTFAVNSDLNLLARTIHYTGTIQNSGPMPPVPNKETTYTLEWKITNLRNHISGATVTTTLPTYVSWKNVVIPQTEAANVVYNDVTRQITWNAGDLAAGTGANAAKIVSMKIGITPSTQQAGATPALTDSIVLTGHDTFTNQDLTINKLPLNTQLLNDGNGPGTYGQVGQ